MVRTLNALRPFTNAARRAANLFARAGKTSTLAEPMFEALEERTVLAADIRAAITAPALTGLASAGGPLTGSVLLTNSGNAAANNFTFRVFISTDTVTGNEDDVELTGVDGLVGTLAAGGSATLNLNSLVVPTDVRPGQYFLIVVLDTTNVIAEGTAGEANNTVITATPFLTLNGPTTGSPNLNATLNFTAQTVNPDQTFTIPTVIRNNTTTAAGLFHVTWVLSANSVIGDADDIAIDEEDYTGLAAGATLPISRNINLPVGINLGAYRVGVWVDDRGDVAEASEADNRAVTSTAALTVALPDITSTFTTTGGTVAPGGFFTGTLTVRNNTQAMAGPFTVLICLSTDNIPGNSDDILLLTVDITDPTSSTVGLAGGATRTISNLRVYIPYGTSTLGTLNPGSYRVSVISDGDNDVTEGNEGNNASITANPIVTVPARNTANDPTGPDLLTYVYQLTGTVQPGQTISVPAIFANLGNAAASSPTLTAYLSTDATFDGNDILLGGYFRAVDTFNPGSIYGLSQFTIPGTAPSGNYYVIFRADPADNITETNEANNTSAATAGTITRATVSIITTDSSAAEVTTGTANPGQYRFTRTGSTASALVIHYSIGGTATANVDYTLSGINGTVVIPAGLTAVAINLDVTNDGLAENDETAILTIDADDYYTVSATQNTATVTILDNEPRVSIVASDAAAGEVTAPAAANPGQFRVTRTGATTAAMVVTFSISGTAAAGDDFSVTGTGVTFDANTGIGTITIPIGATSAVFNVNVVDDAVSENPETVIATPTADANYSVSATQGSATVTIADNEPIVTVAASDAAAAESTGTANPGQFTFSRPSTAGGALTVHFVMSGTASTAVDYTLTSSVAGSNVAFDIGTGEGTITIPAGATSVTLTVNATDDALAEVSETAVVTIVADPAYRLSTTASQRTATVNIADNEPTVTIAVVDASAAEVQTGTPNGAQFRVSRPTTNTAGDLVVHYTLSGTATSGDDYSITNSGTVTILSGQTSALINVTVTDDFIAENTETVIVTLAADGAYNLPTAAAQRSATANIADNEPIVSLVATDNAAAEVVSGGVNNYANFRVSRSGDLSQQLTINVIVSGTASNLDWINFIETTMVIPAGQSFYDNPVIPIDDSIWENTESIVITLQTGEGYHLTSVAAQRTATVNITDNENTVSIAATDRTAGEVVSGTQNPGTFRVSRTGGSNALALSVFYTVTGTATNGTDYTLLSGTAIIPANAAFIDIPITVADDALAEGAETVTLTLNSDASYRLTPTTAQRTGTVSIADNESTVTIAAADAAAAEVTAPGVANAGQYRITRAAGSNVLPLTVFFAVTGTATAGTDFALASTVTGANLSFNTGTGIGSITIPAGATNVTFNLNVVDDLLAENGETAIVTLTADPTYTLSTNAAQRASTVTIADNEPTVTIAARDAAAGEVFTGTANPGVFRITRTGGTTGSLVVNYTIGGTATGGDDYTTLSGTATIPVGAAFVDVTVTALDDLTVEGSETVIVALATDPAYRLGTSAQQTATVTIADNEPTFGVVATDAAGSEAPGGTINYRISRTGGNGQITVVHFSMSGTASTSLDYTLSSSTPGASLVYDPNTGLGTVTFTGTTTQVNILLTPLTDAVAESSETAIITILGADTGQQGYTIAALQTTATGTIANVGP